MIQAWNEAEPDLLVVCIKQNVTYPAGLLLV